MRLVNSAPDSMELRGRDAVRAPVWVGFGLLLGPTLLSLLGPAPFTPLHVAGLVALLTLAVALIALGWPRMRWVRIHTDRRTIATSEDGERPLGGELTVRLIAVPTEGSSGNALYGVGLERDGAGVVLLIAREDPSDVLADLAALKARLPLRVVGGWGLPAGAPWTDLPRPESRGSARLAPWDDRAARRPVAAALVVGAVAISIAIVVEIKGRLDLGDEAEPLSIGLPILGLTLLLVAIVALVTHGIRIAMGPELSCERRIFGFTYARRKVKKSGVRRAYLVSPSGHHVRHVLFDLFDPQEVPVAFPCDDVVGTKVASEFAGASATAGGH
jgi:hypothetical protein